MKSRRDFHFREFSDLDGLVRRKEEAGASVSVVIPARDEEVTIGEIVSSIRRVLMGGTRLVDELLVIDGDSRDATARVAREAGASVYTFSQMPSPPACRGKGAAMWKAQFVSSGSIVVFIDADIASFDPFLIAGITGPLLLDPEIYFVKAYFRRPLIVEGRTYRHHGGRITELLAKPLIRTLLPSLSFIRQPLGGEYALRREVMEQLPFSPGYGVEIGMLIDFFARFGADHVAQVDTDTRMHRNRSIRELGVEATQIARTLLKKLEQYGYLSINDERIFAGSGFSSGTHEIDLAPKAEAETGVERWHGL
jgi:glucosyl-3-phosphoglycerate synthase